MTEDEDFAALLERDQGLPGRYFTEEAVFRRERHLLFESSWMCVGLSADVPAKGDLFPVTVFGQPLLMVRDRDAVRVFHNVCSHRGSPLAEVPAHCGVRIVCPYHGWTYQLDGKLAATPHVGGAGQHATEGIDRTQLGLREVRSAEWAGHVFVNLSGTAPPFSEWIRPAAKRFAHIEWSDLRVSGDLAGRPTVAANWKIVVENFVESYHLPWVHKALNAANDMSGHYQILGGHSYLGQGGTAYQPHKISGADLPHIRNMTAASRYEALAIFPNLILTPLPDMVFSIVLLPEAPERTQERLEFFFSTAAAVERFAAARQRAAGFIKEVNAEDIGIVEAVQRGRHSAAFGGGRFVPAQEATSLQFQKMVAARMIRGPGEQPESTVPLPVRDIPHTAG